MPQALSEPAGRDRRHQRRLRNLLLDARFQLKYAGYLVAIALALSASLGAVLYETSRAAIDQSQQAVSQGKQVVARGREVLEESRKVSAVVQMNIVKDPIYGDNPVLREAFDKDARVQELRLERQHRALREQATLLERQAKALRDSQKTTLVVLALALSAFVFLVGIAGIVLTHRVAGPVFKIKRQLRLLGKGKLPEPGRLRRGDQLVDFFHTYDEAIRRLRDRNGQQLKMVDRALASLGDGETVAREVLTELRATLDE